MKNESVGLPHPFSLRQRIEKTIEMLKKERKNVDGRLVLLPHEGEALVVGDLHGDLKSLEFILENSRFKERVKEDDKIYLICLGDYIDRGPRQVEVVYTLIGLFEQHPDRVFLLRGNHEGPRDLPFYPHDFPSRLNRLYGEEGKTLYSEFRRLFDHLYTAALLQDEALFLHGGIPTQASSIEDVAYADQRHPEKSHLTEILWNDPSRLPGINYSHRGIGKTFGPDVTQNFLHKIGANILIRSHDPSQEGYHFQKGSTLTLFSCKLPHYMNRKAAYLKVPLTVKFSKETLEDHIIQF